MTAPSSLEGAPERRASGPPAASSRALSGSSSASSLVASPVPDFRILGPLGSGPRGDVFRAFDGKRSVALKVLRRGVTIDRRILERFLKTSGHRIRHPNLWSLESIGETTEGSIYYSMPMYGGDSLDLILADLERGFTRKPSLSPLSVGSGGEVHPQFHMHALELVFGAAEGLGRAHREGIAHRRLSPKNILLTPAGHLVITDFGGHPATEGAALLYRAPEELESREEPESARAPADVYSLGVILYQLFVHRRPFEGESSKELKQAIQRGRFPAPRSIAPSVPPRVEACILKAMSQDPSRRQSDASELAVDLKSCLDHLRGDEANVAASSRNMQETHGEAKRERPLFLRRFNALPYRPVTACALFLLLLGAWLGGHGLYLERKKEKGGLEALALLEKGEYSRAFEETQRLQSLDPGDRALPLLANYAKSKAAVSSLERAVKALCEVNVPEAKSAVEEASRLERTSPLHGSMADRLLPELSLDPLERDLSSAAPHRRAAALTQLYLDVSSGARPRDDARLGARALHSGDPEVDRRAVETLALFGASWPILDGLRLGPDGPPVVLPAETFLTLYDALERIFDEDAFRILCGWDLELCESMDRREPGRLTLSAPPNCKVDFGDASPRDFTARWIRGAARLDPPGLVRSAERLSRRQGLVSELLSSLSLVGTPEAKDAILRLALDGYLASPEAALEALSRLGAHSCLLEVARSDRPLPLRERALTLLGYDGAASSLTELRTMALTTPEPSLRKLAFRALSALDDPAAIAVIPGAVDDRELKEGALSWLDRLPTESSQHVLLQLLEHPDHRVRSRAILLLSAPRDSLSRKKSGNTPQNDLLLPLALRLLSGKRETREAALAVILSRGELGRLPGILGRIFQTAQPSASLVRVRQTAEMLFKDYARIAAGLREAAGRLLAGASRIFSDAVEMESAPK